MSRWWSEALAGPIHGDQDWIAVQSLLGDASGVTALAVHVARRNRKKLPFLLSGDQADLADDEDVVDMFTSNALVGAILFLLRQMDDQLRVIKTRPIWSGELEARGLRFRSAFGEIKNAPLMLNHLGDYIFETDAMNNPEVKKWPHPQGGVTFSNEDGRITGYVLFGVTYPLERVLDAAKDLSPVDFPTV